MAQPRSDPPQPSSPPAGLQFEWDDEQLRFLTAAGSILVASLDYEQVLTGIARLVVSFLSDWCSISVVESGDIRQIALACRNPAHEPIISALQQLKPSASSMALSRQAIERRETILSDPVDDTRYTLHAENAEYLQLMRQIGPRSSLVVPLAVRNEIRGAISFTMSPPDHRITPRIVALAEELCRRTALAVDNALLMRAAQRRLNELTTVQRVAQAITSDLRLDQICQTVVDQINRAFGYQLISIYLREGEALYLQSVIGYDSVIPVIQLAQGASGRVARSGEPVFVRAAAQDPDFMFAMPGICQAIIVPLRYGDGPALGTLAVESNGTPILNDDDLALLTLLADQVSVAVMNARLFARVEDSARRFSSLIELAGSVIICTAPDLSITEFNREAERVYGVARTEVLGTSYLRRFVNPDHRDRFAAHAWSALAGQPTTFETTWQIPTGEERSFVWILTCRSDSEGSPAELMLIAQDITARKRAEEERLAIERKLQETQRLESLGVLAGGIAHDFNNLLTAITGNAGLLLLDLAPNTPAYQSAVEIETVAQRAADLVRHMLIYAGRGKVNRQPTAINTLVSEMVVMLRFSIRKDAIIQQNLAADIPMIEADTAQIRQVVMNLIVNAAEALPANGGTITISTALRMIERSYLAETYPAADLPEGAYVVLTVSDTGIGMDAATQARIFDPFFSTKFTGRGLGLAAVLGIMRGHWGALHIESAPGMGSTFSVLFPALTAPHAQGATPEQASPAISPSASTLVLVIDDEDEVRQMAARILERSGYTVVQSAYGEAGVQIFRQHHAELAFVLLDMTMPHMDGEKTMRELRMINPAVPVVLMSGYTIEDLNQQLHSLRPDAFLQKPFSPDDLLARIGGALATCRTS
ncbi:GAF domain-containing protein [Oscillochloris sp. ZM17-4]|uniref:GAF domain-containing protein n=1 Tax=Oscillochloris sp. ZM17-4 TaxID=2866714 RepID=UPI001C73CD9E|nr:GAF domain-containing protein [Oscillochloris sp. ZM17-4]MBX0328945.1 GAF domain-containing protein [Oscillochloris sp. ZM17-4]